VIERAAAAGIKLVISVDAGTRAFAAAESARHAGVDLIITDHHLPGADGLPHACAVVNPNQPGCGYPCKSLCGAGIAFKFAQALVQKRLAGRDQPQLLRSFMKIAAIATIADSVPLIGENRVITSLGLNALRNAVNPGLKALLETAQLSTGKPLNSGEIAFRVAPRINAAGRMDIAQDVIDLFSVKDAAQAREIALRLDKLNSDRQEEERRIVDAIEQRLIDDPALRESYCMVIDGDSWHRGVIGITATRDVERYGRPALVISRDGQEAHGSGRSIPCFHLLDALESCAGLFTRYGGHAHAVGFSLPSERVPELRTRLDDYAHSKLNPSDFDPVLKVDAPPKIIKDKHVRLKLACGAETQGWRRSLTHNAVGWRMAERVAEEKLLPGDNLDIAFTLDENDHPEFGGVELTLRDFRAARAESAAATKG
jgi:single-stranded-DNA-specific exonuclease